MNDCCLIQHVYENSEYIHLIEMSFLRHGRYCVASKMDFHFSMDGDNPKEGDWSKVRLIREALAKGYKYVIYLDADALIYDVTVDLRSGCVNDICAIKYDHPVPHLQCGVLYFTNTELTRQFVDEWWDRRPGTTNWKEQTEFCILALEERYNDHVTCLDPRLNCTMTINPVENPIVLAWHGFSLQSTVPIIAEGMKKAILSFKKPNTCGA